MSQNSGIALPVGTVLQSNDSSFRLLEILGSGGFGVTYRANEIGGLQRPAVAIKEYLPYGISIREDEILYPVDGNKEVYEQGLASFLKEARLLALFNDENIVRILSYFKSNGTAYIVMDYLPGKSLASLINKRVGNVFNEQEVLTLMRPIILGLQTIHSKLVWHLDIKPHNIYLAQRTATQELSPILLDFGTARQEFGEASRSLDVILTPGYAPFEQYQTRGKIGPWSDIYALSATIYQLLSGEIPPDAIALQSQSARLKPLHEINQNVSLSLSRLISRGMSNNYQNRPGISDFLEFIDAKKPEREEKRSISEYLAFVIIIFMLMLMGFMTGSLFLTVILPLVIATFFFLPRKTRKNIILFPKRQNQVDSFSDFNLSDDVMELFVLKDSSGMFTGKSIPLNRELLVGRDSARVNIVFSDLQISGLHAKFSPIETRPGWCRVSDLGSKNKIYYQSSLASGNWLMASGNVDLPKGSRVCLADERTVVIELR